MGNGDLTTLEAKRRSIGGTGYRSRLGSATPGFRGVGFFEAIGLCIKGTTFRGRASRSEYWYFWLFATLAQIFATILFDVVLNTPTATVVWNFGFSLFLTLALIRRLHDVNRSGGWILLAFTIVGIIPLFIWAVRRGDPLPNRFDHPSRALNVEPVVAAEPIAVIERVEKLHRLRLEGVLSEEEFQTLKKRSL